MLITGVPFDCYRNSHTALIWAARYNGIDIAKVLLESGADVNIHDGVGNTPLIKAALYNNTGIMEVMLHHCPDPSIVNIVNMRGQPALDVALAFNNKEAIRLLKNIR